jgi:DNA-directed RNA polymerase specialized sigma24 family protein
MITDANESLSLKSLVRFSFLASLRMTVVPFESASHFLAQAVEQLRPKVRIDREDDFQDAVLRLWTRLCDGAQRPENCAGLLVKIMHDLCVDRARREQRSQEIGRGVSNGKAETADVLSPLTWAIRSEEAEMLRVAIDSLEEPTRFVVRARLRGADYRAIGRELVWAVGSRCSEVQLRYVWASGARRLARDLAGFLT